MDSHLSSPLPRNFGSHVTVRPSVPQANQCEMGIFYFVWSLLADRRPLWSSWPHEKDNNKAESFFFRLTFNVYADVDNRERARARDKKNKGD